MIKKLFALMLVAIALVMSVTTASAVVELGEIDAPYNVMYKVYDDTAAERVSISCSFTDKYAALTSATNEDNMAKYGIINVSTYVQIDYRIDGGEWHEDMVWGTTPNSADYGGTVAGGGTVGMFDLLYLINESDIKNAGALATKDEKGRDVFDLKNHTLEFKVRTTMTYTKGSNIQVTTSPWTDVIKVERDNKAGKAPDKLEAPVINTPEIAYQENQMPYLTFFVRTPESIKENQSWFFTQDSNNLISLQVEIDKGDGSWQAVNVASSGHFVNETKAIFLDAVDVEDVSTMKIRAQYIVYMKDKTLYSDYSEELEFSVPRWEEGKGILPAKCQFCGICRPIAGKCAFVVGGIALLVAAIAIVPIKMSIDKAKAKKAAEQEEKQRKLEEERAAYDKAKKEKKNKNKKG